MNYKFEKAEKSTVKISITLDAAEWSAAQLYRKGDKVRHSGIVWAALQDSTGQEPSAADFNGDYSREDYGNPYWRPYNTLSDYVRRLAEGGMAAVVQAFLQTKQLAGETRGLLERRAFFDGAGRIKATEQNRHRIVGYEIVPIRSMGVTAKIERVGLQMYGGTGTVRLYLFHSSQPEPVRTFELQYTLQNGGYQWFALDGCHLPYISGGNNAGGAWYLCYDQDELPTGTERPSAEAAPPTDTPARFPARTREIIPCPRCGKRQQGNRDLCYSCKLPFVYDDETPAP